MSKYVAKVMYVEKQKTNSNFGCREYFLALIFLFQFLELVPHLGPFLPFL
jgi:hypothetical protein